MPTTGHPHRGSRASKVTLALAGVAATWLAAAVVARLPGSVASTWTEPLLVAVVIATYAGSCAALVAASRRPRAALVRCSVVTLVLVALLGLAELAALLRWVHWPIVVRRLSGDFHYPTAFVSDADLGFRRIPGLRWTGRPASDIEASYGLPRSLDHPISFSYDRWGYRNAVEMEQADVVVLGDSYVEGWYVSDEETMAARLAERLARPVANLGVAGYGTLQELRVLRGDALARRPRAVVWVFFEGNDLYDDDGFEQAVGASPPGERTGTSQADGTTRRHGWRRRSLVREGFFRLGGLAHPLVPRQVPYRALLPWPDGRVEPYYDFDYAGVPWTEYEEERWRIARGAFEDGLAFARERAIDLVLVYAPIKFRVYGDRLEIPPGSPLQTWQAWPLLPERFRELCADAAASCIDLTAPFREAVARGRSPFPANDTHWSPEGHAIAAAAVAGALREASGEPRED